MTALLALSAPFVTALGLTAVLVGALIGWLRRRDILDHPNERSSHHAPTPRGGGLAVVPAILAAWLLYSDLHAWSLIGGAVVLMGLSWIDDRRGLSALQRLIAQILVCGLVIAALKLPVPGFINALALLALIWFLNLYNFMDGIDGITGIETLGIGIGIALVEALTGGNDGMIAGALALAGGACGFLIWNWHPARIFMGDSGSVPLGLLLGGLLLMLAVHGQWAPALILPAYYGTDATITLVRRIIGREKIWQAHRKHFYQRALRGTGFGPHGHAQISRAIGIGNLALIGAAVVAAIVDPWLGLGLGAAIVALLLGLLSRWAQGAPP